MITTLLIMSDDVIPKELQDVIYYNTGDDYALINNESAIADRLRVEKEKLGLLIHLPPPNAPGYLKVAKPIVDACIERYKQSQEAEEKSKDSADDTANTQRIATLPL